MVVKKHKERKGKEKKPREGRKKREKKLRTRVHGDINKSKKELVGERSSKKRACEV
jgi:hypothetical protein